MSDTPSQPPFKKTVFAAELPNIVGGMADADKAAGLKQPVEFTYHCSASDWRLIREIAARGVMEARIRQGVELKEIDLSIDVATVHCHTRPMHLLQFLMADPADFAECLIGIGVNLDRTTGHLMNGFVPRFAVHAS